MKKILTILLCVILMLSLCACGKKSGNGDVTPDNTPAADPAASGQDSGQEKEVDAITSATANINWVPRYNGNKNSDILVAYFSTDDTVRAFALHAAQALNADLFEIIPAEPYTDDDLNYNAPVYRAGREQKEGARPAIKSMPEDMSRYKYILLGYPIWGGQAPAIMYTFLENADLHDVEIIPFCTSNSSNAGTSATNMQKVTDPSVKWREAFRLIRNGTVEDIRNWLESLEIAELK